MNESTDHFADLTQRYESWFERYHGAYVSELLAIRALLPHTGRGLEIGVGTGRFAAPLGVQFGIDPSAAMVRHARGRGAAVAIGRAEALPYRAGVFDYALVVTTICFVDDPAVMLAETRRVLRPGGTLVIGAVDRDSALGRDYLANQSANPFYRHATFYSAADIEALVAAAGFADPCWAQTLAGGLEPGAGIEAVCAGRGEGAFVVLRATR